MWYRYFSAFRILFHRKSAEFRIFVHGIPWKQKNSEEFELPRYFNHHSVRLLNPPLSRVEWWVSPGSSSSLPDDPLTPGFPRTHLRDHKIQTVT
jgi:hypothetical protein